MRWIPLGMALAGLLAGEAARAAPTMLDSGTILGRVHLARPAGHVTGVLFLYSDRDGWTPELAAAAGRLAGDGLAVVGVDLAPYLAALDASDERDCHYLVSVVEELSKRLQKELDVERYRTPLLAGVGMGGTLAYAALAQAPAVTVAGAVSLDPSATVTTRLPICKGAPFTPAEGGFAYGRRDALPGWWRVASRGGADPFAFADNVAGAARVAVPADADLATALAAVLEPMLEASGAAAGDDLADLPLVPIAPQGPGTGLLAVIVSGDGGWRDIDKQIGEWLAARGVGVVGLDSLRYFWSKKPPETIARDLRRIFDHYLALFDARAVVLIGYSFGADVLPATWRAMAPADRDRVVQLSLLGLSTAADFEFHVSGWLGLGHGKRPVALDAPSLDPARVQCFYGVEESDSFCREPAFAAVERIETKGGHHFDGDYAALARRILEGAQRRLAASAP